MTNSAITVSSLNFNTIKNNLKKYLQGQSKFSDYDFDGSNMSVILDLLAFNAYNQSFYLNMIGNEMFLESAQLRENVVARAKELGYIPTSIQGASATLQLTVTPTNNNIDSVLVPRNTSWSTTLDNNTLTFVTPQAYTIDKNANGNFVQNIEIIEGNPLTHRFLVSTSNTDFKIPNDNIDTRSLIVDVLVSNTNSTSDRYIRSNDVLNKASNSQIFFLEEESDGKFEISFGDGVIGKKPVVGNVVRVQYRACNGTQGNGANSFSFDGNSIDGHSNVSFSVVSASSGGVNRQSIESIKYNAPKFFERQNRNVIPNDYKTFIKENYPDISAVSVWGGEENNPPRYGRVFLSMKPVSGDVLSNTKKQNILRDLVKKNITTVTPEIVDAEILYIELDLMVKYNPNKTIKSAGTLKSEIIAEILKYNTQNLTDFGEKFRKTQLVRNIHDLNSAILSLECGVKMQKRIKPTIGTAKTWELNFHNEFISQDPNHIPHEGHTPTVFTKTGYITFGQTTFFQDNGNGTLYSYRLNIDGSQIVLRSSIGTVDYINGIVILDNFNPTSIIDGNIIKITAKPEDCDILSTQRNLIQIDSEDIKITMVEDE